MFSLKVAGQIVGVIVSVADSVWDGFQLSYSDAKGNVIGRGDFEVDGYRIFASSFGIAERIAKRLAKDGIVAKADQTDTNAL